MATATIVVTRQLLTRLATQLALAVEMPPADVRPGDRIIGHIDVTTQDLLVDHTGPAIVGAPVKVATTLTGTYYTVHWLYEDHRGEVTMRGVTQYKGSSARLLVCRPH